MNINNLINVMHDIGIPSVLALLIIIAIGLCIVGTAVYIIIQTVRIVLKPARTLKKKLPKIKSKNIADKVGSFVADISQITTKSRNKHH